MDTLCSVQPESGRTPPGCDAPWGSDEPPLVQPLHQQTGDHPKAGPRPTGIGGEPPASAFPVPSNSTPSPSDLPLVFNHPEISAGETFFEVLVHISLSRIRW